MDKYKVTLTVDAHSSLEANAILNEYVNTENGISIRSIEEIPEIHFTRVSSDMCGNPRYACHYLDIDKDYATAVKLANQIGGRKYNNKSYGGGIVFQSYNIQETINQIKGLKS